MLLKTPEDKTPTSGGEKPPGSTTAAGPPTSDAFSPTFSSTENEEKDASGSAAVSTTGEAHGVQRVISGTKRAQALIRSDSTGSSTGRKYLAPTTSDPQQRSTLTDKERLHISSQQKKKNSMTAVPILPPVAAASGSAIKRDLNRTSGFFASGNNDGSQFHYPPNVVNHFGEQHGPLGSPSAIMGHIIAGSKLLPFNNQANAVYEVHDWWQEQVICTLHSDDEG